MAFKKTKRDALRTGHDHFFSYLLSLNVVGFSKNTRKLCVCVYQPRFEGRQCYRLNPRYMPQTSLITREFVMSLRRRLVKRC